MSGAGHKRARSEASKPEGVSNEDYLAQLKAEQESISTDTHPHAARLVAAEIERMANPAPPEPEPQQQQSTGIGPQPNTDMSMSSSIMDLPWEKPDDGSGIKCVLMPDETTAGGKTKSSMKVFMPDNTPDGRMSASRGRVLGPQGATLRTLQSESRCKMSLKGKGSIKYKDGTPEISYLTNPAYAHLNEDFHLLCEYDGAPDGRNQAFRVAESLVRTVLNGGTVIPGSTGFGPLAGKDLGGGSAFGRYGQTSASSAELAYAETAVAAGQIVSVLSSHTEMGGACKTGIKIFIPERTPLGCSRGKILGQRGTTLKQLQAECGCKMSIRGRSSMKVNPGETAESMAAVNPTYKHLMEPLHVLCEYEGPSQLRDATLQGAEALIRAILTPAGEGAQGGYQISQYELMHQHYPMPSQTGFSDPFGAAAVPQLGGFDASAAYSAQLATQMQMRGQVQAPGAYGAYGMGMQPTFY